ncbi:hypothetical protein V865_004419 [Kwoniella europaea PYCC6329]|uniref:Uncharacterized protein n=1 Tax=Kwoniella europaea PYCC6329 TaxID=1423913 RepID=A0AAX4KK01_9TREE
MSPLQISSSLSSITTTPSSSSSLSSSSSGMRSFPNPVAVFDERFIFTSLTERQKCSTLFAGRRDALYSVGTH